jgi:purine-binding chemotaxis protein CheW
VLKKDKWKMESYMKFARDNSLDLALPSLDLTGFSDLRSSKTIGEKYLVFFLGEELYAISSKNVIEAAPALSFTTFLNAPGWLLGIANLRGELVSVINLPRLLGKENTMPAPKSKFIILRSQTFEGDAAFAADRISEIIVLSDKEIQSFTDENDSHIHGKAVYKTQTLKIIDIEKLLSALVIRH